MSKKKKYYVVWSGAKIGVLDNWDDCKRSVNGFEGAKYKSYESLAEAQKAFKEPADWHIGKGAKPDANQPAAPKTASGSFIRESLAVDAACSGNPGDMEYRGVYVATGEQWFHLGPMPQGTNNIGEFLALVHGLALLKKMESDLPIYTDSKTALAWVRQKKCKTTLERNKRNEQIFDLVERAEIWLHNNSFKTVLYKWETEDWGEIPADFGRK
jgi:ribonuclease HI